MYNIRARFLPAVLGMAPAFALAAIAVSWNVFSLPQVIATGAIGVLFITFSDLARRFGKRAERRLFNNTNGRPTSGVFSFRDPTIDPTIKARYRRWLDGQLGEPGPTADEESDPAAVHAYYERCATWLRERTRDTTKFKVLFEENITYGFRRNLYGLKWFVLALNTAIVIACIYMLAHGKDLVGENVLTTKIYAVLLIAILHALYFLFVASRKSVEQASDQYARQLMLSCEGLMAG